MESSKSKKALITGITGQDGSILAELYIKKGYQVHGLVRRNSSETLNCAENIKDQIRIHYGDLSDQGSIDNAVNICKPDVFINCAAQSHVKRSFEMPEYTFDITGNGVLRCLEAIRKNDQLIKKTKFLQLSSSEMFGNSVNDKNEQDESTTFKPASPYAIAKCAGYYTVRNYRESYGIFASNAISFNHEEPGKRGPNFVTRKVSLGVARIVKQIKRGLEPDPLIMGNLSSMRDWGRGLDYCKGMIKMLEHHEPDDFVLATGESKSIIELLECAFSHVNLDWRAHVVQDEEFFRPKELDYLRGNPRKAKKKLKWEPETSFEELIKMMVDYDMEVDILSPV
jgi:GDPmannose 4,6-dehydratase